VLRWLARARAPNPEFDVEAWLEVYARAEIKKGLRRTLTRKETAALMLVSLETVRSYELGAIAKLRESLTARLDGEQQRSKAGSEFG